MGNKCGSGQQQDTDLPQAPKIFVLVKGALGLPVGDWSAGNNDRVLTFGVGSEPGGQEQFLSSQKTNVVDPVWNEEVELAADKPVYISVFQAIGDGDPTPLAYATLDMSATAVDSFNGELPLEADGNAIGSLSLKARSGDDYPPDVSGEFNVTLDNQKKKALGLEVDSMDPDKLFVISVKKNTAVDIYNGDSQPENKVEAGLFITGVDTPDVGSGGCLGAGSGKASGATPSAAMEKVLKKTPKRVDLVCRRAMQFRIVLTLKEKGGLGVIIPQKPMGTSVLITKIKEEGPASVWNANNADQMVTEFDRIIAVDDKPGKGGDLLKALKAAQQTVILTIVRMAPASAPPAEGGNTTQEAGWTS